MPADVLGLLGQTIEGQYRLDELVGEGGFSYLYRATNLGLGEPVAVKCLKVNANGEFESQESFQRRFRDEGRLLYRLSQGNLDIVRCLMGGATRSPATQELVPFLVLDWLSGRTLSAELRDRRAVALHGRPLDEVLTLFEPAVLALEHAHKHGVVHRDIKPANLFLARALDGTTRMKVLDFGVAKIVDDTMGMTRAAATAGSFMMCSPSYAAPEQFEPKVGPVGAWTDVYSIALIVLEALRDSRVRQTKGMLAAMLEALDANIRLDASALGIEVPPAVEQVLSAAVAMDPRARPQSAGDFWRDLTAASFVRRQAEPPAPATVLSATPPAPQTPPEPPPPPAFAAPAAAMATLPLGVAPPGPAPQPPPAAARPVLAHTVPLGWQPPPSAGPSSPRHAAPSSLEPPSQWTPTSRRARPPSSGNPQLASSGPVDPAVISRKIHRATQTRMTVAAVIAVAAAAALVAEVIALLRMRGGP